MNELTLEWLEAGRNHTQKIYEQQPSKNPGTVRIGRDSAQCDIVLSHPTVSGLIPNGGGAGGQPTTDTGRQPPIPNGGGAETLSNVSSSTVRGEAQY